MEKKIAIIRGDGIGPEIMTQAIAVLDAVAAKFGHTFTYEDAPMGGNAIDAFGVPLPESSLKTCLACSTKVGDNMYVATLPFFPLVKEVYDINKVKPTEQIMMQLYPEIYACVGCNACTQACTQGLNVMQYIAYAQRAEYEKCAEESFDCVMCGVCSSRCPAGISHPQVAMLARRLNGKYIAPHCDHLDERIKEINEGKYELLLEDLMGKPIEEMQELYNHRDIEK